MCRFFALAFPHVLALRSHDSKQKWIFFLHELMQEIGGLQTDLDNSQTDSNEESDSRGTMALVVADIGRCIGSPYIDGFSQSPVGRAYRSGVLLLGE